MFSFLRKSPKEEQTLLVCLITSHAVTGAVVKMFKRPGAIERPVVLYAHEVFVRLPELHSVASLNRDVSQALREVVTQCRKKYPKYDAIHCCLGEPWIVTSTRTAHLEKRDPFLVNEKLINDLVTRETKLFEQEMAQQYAELPERGLIETGKPVVEINGYRVDRSLYQSKKGIPQAQTVDVHITYSITEADIIEEILEVFLDTVHHTNVVFQSFDHAKVFLLDAMKQGTICELGGLTMPCMVVSEKVPTHFASIPASMHTFERALMNLFAVTRSKINTLFAFTRDENILHHERDVYHKRILGAYHAYGTGIPFHVSQVKKFIGDFREPVIVIGRPEWIGQLKDLLSADFGTSLIIPPQDLLRDQVLVAHETSAVSIPIMLAVIHATTYEYEQ